jgi:signal-transduction protein with cAMP-binding, CBS, and nucleotidyltransferase domain
MTTVKSVMKEKLVTISDTSTLQAAARLMKTGKVGSLLVQKGKELIGILTETDIVQKAIANDSPLNFTKVEDVMSDPLLTVEAACSIVDASCLMAERSVRHLVVTERKSIIGIISIRDVLQSNELTWISIRSLMSTTVFLVARASSISEAAKLMKDNKIGSLLVTGRRQRPRTEPFLMGNKKEIIGILTETDIIRKVVAENLNPLTAAVEKVMSRSLAVIEAWKRAAKACDLMAQNRIRHLPVTEDQKVIGMISIRDLVNPLYYNPFYYESLPHNRNNRQEN